MHVSVPIAALAVITLLVMCWRIGVFATLLAALAGSALSIMAGLLTVAVTGINLIAELANRIGG